MAIFLRTVAIIVEVLILAVLSVSVLYGLRLAIFDLGINMKYTRAVTMFLVVIFAVLMLFFIAHLSSFYPTIG